MIIVGSKSRHFCDKCYGIVDITYEKFHMGCDVCESNIESYKAQDNRVDIETYGESLMSKFKTKELALLCMDELFDFCRDGYSYDAETEGPFLGQVREYIDSNY
tara:strand:- start:6416 stop:6727 length:312 start_codon:yes stop_codon:yes gene_type:complete